MQGFAASLATFALLVASASSALGQDAKRPAEAPASGAAMASPPAGAARLTRLLGAEVEAADGAPLGVVNEVLIDRTGATRALVIAVAGARGLGEKNIALRADGLNISESPRAIGLISPGAIAQPASPSISTSLTQQDIVAAPGFEPERRPATAGTPESVHEPKSSTASGGPG